MSCVDKGNEIGLVERSRAQKRNPPDVSTSSFANELLEHSPVHLERLCTVQSGISFGFMLTISVFGLPVPFYGSICGGSRRKRDCARERSVMMASQMGLGLNARRRVRCGGMHNCGRAG